MATEAKQLSLWAGLEASCNERDETHDRQEYTVRRNPRARRLLIKVHPGGRVEVVVPRRTGSRAIRDFIEEHRDWIERARRKLTAVAPSEPFRLPDVVDLPAIEQRYRVHYEPRPEVQSVRFHKCEQSVVLRGKTADNSLCVAALKRWLSSIARRELELRLQELSLLTGHRYRALQIRGQRTRWGSYSSTGTVSLNYCLLFLDPELLRYLIVHELCHARQMNHSRRFWQLVEVHEPNYRRLDRALAEGWKHVPTWLGMH